MSVIRKCVCCGKEYDFCPNCAKKEQPAWMVTFCSVPCKELFNIVSAYNANRIGKAAVQAYVAEHHITGTNYAEPIRKVLEETVVKTKWDMPNAVPEKKEINKVENFNNTYHAEKNNNEQDGYRKSRSRKRRHKQIGY